MDMFDEVIAKAREMTGVAAPMTDAMAPVKQAVTSLYVLHDAVAPWLDSLAKLTEQADQLDADLQSDPRYAQLKIIRANIGNCEENIKTTLKGSGIPDIRMESSGYEAVLQTRRMKGVMHYDIQAIEQEPTLATCITKAVNEKLFKAVVEAKLLNASMYCTPEAGKDVQAVIIRKVEDKKPTVADKGV
jgi:copper chaperone CopZ